MIRNCISALPEEVLARAFAWIGPIPYSGLGLRLVSRQWSESYVLCVENILLWFDGPGSDCSIACDTRWLCWHPGSRMCLRVVVRLLKRGLISSGWRSEVRSVILPQQFGSLEHFVRFADLLHYLPNILSLRWTRKDTRDCDLQCLGSVAPQLQFLDASNSAHLTDEGVSQLSSLSRLQHLHLSETPRLSGAGLGPLKTLTQLITLDLWKCPRISDEGLAALQGMTQLNALFLGGCRLITDAGLTHLSGLTLLHTLDLSDCRCITDQGLANLRGMTQMRSLYLRDCPLITHVGLTTNVKAMRGTLQTLDVFGSVLVGSGLELLQAAVPTTRVVYHPSPVPWC